MCLLHMSTLVWASALAEKSIKNENTLIIVAGVFLGLKPVIQLHQPEAVSQSVGQSTTLLQASRASSNPSTF